VKTFRSNTGNKVDGVAYTQHPSPEIGMAAFDRLPAKVRRAVSAAPFNFDTLAIVDALGNGMTAADMEKNLTFSALDYVEKAYADRGVAEPRLLAKKLVLR
jgi:hypothetical protein